MTTDNMTKAAFDPLDMGNYKVEKLPKMQKSKFEVWMARLGGPLAIAAFVWICWFCHIGFIDNLDTSLWPRRRRSGSTPWAWPGSSGPTMRCWPSSWRVSSCG
jgi:hypothetical protein